MAGTKIAAFIGFGFIFIGAFLPWAQMGVLSVNGTDGDGVFTLVLAVVGAALVYFWDQHERLPAAAGIVAGLVLLIGGYDTISIADTDPILGIEVEIGSGMYLTIIGALVAGVAALVEAAQQRKKVSPQVDEQDSDRRAA